MQAELKPELPLDCIYKPDCNLFQQSSQTSQSSVLISAHQGTLLAVPRVLGGTEVWALGMELGLHLQLCHLLTNAWLEDLCFGKPMELIE